MNFVIREVESGLKDLSVSRPSERVQWGIPVPEDPSQTIYVWLDALMNYAVQAGYPWPPSRATSGGWPADVQVIGKDIIRCV
jgi:methionyl-tRNA synthetase